MHLKAACKGGFFVYLYIKTAPDLRAVFVVFRMADQAKKLIR